MTAVKHFLDLDRFDTKTLRDILDLAGSLKRAHADGVSKPVFAGKTLVMIFEKPSTRTRVSFQVGMQHLGGQVVVMSDAESQLGRGESIADTARVLSRYADAIMIRTDDPKKLEDLEAYATVPVINGLTNYSHPCQIMADVMTYEEHRGPIKGRVVAWSGDGNNVANSWIHAAVRFGFTLRLACPDSLKPAPEILQWAVSEGGDITVTDDAAAAVDGADLVNADTWVSMGDADADARMKLLEPFRVDQALMAGAKADALFMHCLPAHRGEEVTDEVMDGPQSVIWDEAENRLHAQKGILAWCLG
ncbi:MAG TPA: ornithine carbamoyltransferase [Rhodospirillales bacterium]|jgi:ornithine carbamoyltransferase|nr:MAG: Ornithine carbamoyltransferase [Alphaproteobacteria bacterium MarineAlpha3_Bin1]PPR74123.1 MAG: Ornithine carbamoyltransferase [Alphaproteobacteria bacterium MarineAlpha3_Bin2]HIE20611.1 ornithine carbamoyltransferase [Rhodospirillales bacterium]HIM24643.1 ornithine carbamoyltransferase [Rhodospirillales bacterium]